MFCLVDQGQTNFQVTFLLPALVLLKLNFSSSSEVGYHRADATILDNIALAECNLIYFDSNIDTTLK